MKKIFVLILIAILFSSCTEKSSDAKYMIPAEDLTEIVICNPLDDRITPMGVYYYSDNFIQNIESNNICYVPVKQKGILSSIKFLDTSYPFGINSDSNYRFIIRIEDIQKYEYSTFIKEK